MTQRLSNAQAKFFTRLRRDKKVRDSEELFMAEGGRTVRELIHASPDLLVALLLLESATFDFSIAVSKTFFATEKQFQQLCETEQPQGVVGIFKQPVLTRDILFAKVSKKANASILALDNIQDAGNLGTIIRAAAWFEFDALMASNGTADFFNPKVVRSTAGSLFALPLLRCDSLVSELSKLKQSGFKCFGADLVGESLARFSFAKKSILVIGNEGNGVSPEVLQMCDSRLRIDGNSTRVESLNVAVSAGILMAKRYEELKLD